jgi:hypothetical protein
MELDIPNHVDTGGVCGLAVSPDGKRLAEVSSCGDGDGATIREWLLDGGGAISHLAYAPESAAHSVLGYGFGGDATALRAWIATNPKTIAIDPASGEVIDEFPDDYGLVPTDDPNVVYALTLVDDSLAIYDVVRHAAVDGIDLGFHPEAWSVLGTLMAVGGPLPIVHVRIIEFEGELALGPLIDGTGRFEVLKLALDSRGLLLALSLDGGARFQIERHDPKTGEVTSEPAAGFRDFALSGGVTVFVTTDGRLLQVDSATLKPIGYPFGDVGTDDWLTIDEQGRRLVILGRHPLDADAAPIDSLRIYDVAARTQLGGPIDLGENALDWGRAAFRSDGMELAVDTEHGIVVWDLDPSHWVEPACDIAGRNLTRSEWDQYIGDVAPYRATCPQFVA